MYLVPNSIPERERRLKAEIVGLIKTAVPDPRAARIEEQLDRLEALIERIRKLEG